MANVPIVMVLTFLSATHQCENDMSESQYTLSFQDCLSQKLHSELEALGQCTAYFPQDTSYQCRNISSAIPRIG